MVAGSVWAQACGRTQPQTGEARTPDAVQSEEAARVAPAAVAAHGRVSPLARPATAQRAALVARVEAGVRAGVDAERPWGLVHALVALGPELRMSDGRRAVDAVLDAGRSAEGRFGAGVVLPRTDPAGVIPIEPHAMMVVKTLAEIGVDPGATLAAPWGQVRAEALLSPALEHLADAAAGWDDRAWALQAAATWLPRGAAWPAAGGEAELGRLAADAVADLEGASAALRALRDAGAPLVKDRTGVLAYACGGAHLLQAAGSAAARVGDGALTARVVQLAELHVWRIDQEIALLDRLARAHPESSEVLEAQRLKVVGHGLETAHHLAALGVGLAPAAAIARWAAALEPAVEAALARHGDAVAAGAPASGSDLWGDLCHALHALRLDAGEALVFGG
jgi:hypothetical protein